MITSATKTLQLAFTDTLGKSRTFSLKDPKDGLDKATVDAAANTIIEKNIFKTEDNGDLQALKECRIVTRQVETIDA